MSNTKTRWTAQVRPFMPSLVIDAEGYEVAAVYNGVSEMHEKRVHLIASAPDLLAALRDIMERQTSKGELGGGYFTLSGDCIRHAEAAIARAEGR